MGSSQSTNSSRAAKFSGNTNRRSVREVKSAPLTDVSRRRAASARNTNRSVKEFSKFWSDAGQLNRSKASTSRQSTKKGSSNGNLRRNRAQSVDARRISNSLPIPITRESRQNRSRGGSIRGHSASPSPSTYTSSPNSTLGRDLRNRSRHSSTCESTHLSTKSDIYSPEFNQAAIAAARLKRLSLTPYTADQKSPHHLFQRPYSQHRETAIY